MLSLDKFNESLYLTFKHAACEIVDICRLMHTSKGICDLIIESLSAARRFDVFMRCVRCEGSALIRHEIEKGDMEKLQASLVKGLCHVCDKHLKRVRLSEERLRTLFNHNVTDNVAHAVVCASASAVNDNQYIEILAKVTKGKDLQAARSVLYLRTIKAIELQTPKFSTALLKDAECKQRMFIQNCTMGKAGVQSAENEWSRTQELPAVAEAKGVCHSTRH